MKLWKPKQKRTAAASLLGRLAAAGMSATILGIAATSAEALPLPATANNERQYRNKLMAIATLSMMTSQIAVARARNTEARAFATFELNESTGVRTVLSELGTAVPPMDAQDRTTLARIRNTPQGSAFDRAYITAQYEAHVFLRNLNTAYLQTSARRRNRINEQHTRHIAMLSLPAINEHIAHTQTILRLLT